MLMIPNLDQAILLLDKPLGLSSNQALQKVKRLIGAKKAGHTGSLDPFATGLLPVCLGKATKIAQKLIDTDKSYVAHIRFGAGTTTGDPEGQLINPGQPIPKVTDVKETLHKFLGNSEQIPPMYSALKYQGQPLYKLARQGKTIPRPPRQIHISKLELVCYKEQDAIVEIRCSKGTYIRTLAEDIAKELNTAAHLTGLKRTAVGSLSLDNAYSIEQIAIYQQQKKIEDILLDPASLAIIR